MRSFVATPQSVSYFSICHRYSLLCYRAAIRFAFTRFMLRSCLWHSVTATSPPPGSLNPADTEKLYVLKMLCVAFLCNKREKIYLSLSWPAFISHRKRPSLCSIATERCISRYITLLGCLGVAQHEICSYIAEENVYENCFTYLD